METREDWPVWGRLIDDARDRMDLSQNEAARRAGITGTHWRKVVKGEAGDMTSPRGVRTVARMADVVQVQPEQLESVGRADVAAALARHQPDPDEADLVARFERIRRNPAARKRLVDLLRAARLPEAEEEEDRRAGRDAS